MVSIRADLSTPTRLYVQTAYGDPTLPELKRLGFHYDRDLHDQGQKGLWWIGKAKRKQVEELLVASDQKEDAAREAGETTPAVKEDPKDVRLVGKARYKGKTYYIRFIGPTKRGYQARLISLDGKVDFWARAATPGERHIDGSGDVAAMIKEYRPREAWNGFYYSGKATTEYPTLASIRKFVERQSSPDTRTGECTECSARGIVGETCRKCHEGTHA